jgi:hypothetical protein
VVLLWRRLRLWLWLRRPNPRVVAIASNNIVAIHQACSGGSRDSESRVRFMLLLLSSRAVQDSDVFDSRKRIKAATAPEALSKVPQADKRGKGAAASCSDGQRCWLQFNSKQREVVLTNQCLVYCHLGQVTTCLELCEQLHKEFPQAYVVAAGPRLVGVAGLYLMRPLALLQSKRAHHSRCSADARASGRQSQAGRT